MTLDLDLPSAGAVILAADRDQVLQVVQNLVENAIKFSPLGEAVAISVRPPAAESFADARFANTMTSLGRRIALLTPERGRAMPRATLGVRDRGPGIPRAALPRLTERFYRVDDKRTRDYPGTGLGLAIVKHIVNRHLGGFSVDSVEGDGAYFEVALPTAPAFDDEDAHTGQERSAAEPVLTAAPAAGLPKA